MKQVIINGKALELPPDTRIVLSRQSNNLTKPDYIQVDFSQTFTAPFTKVNQEALQHAEEIQSLSSIPYERLSAQVLSKGIEIVPHGQGELLSVNQNGYELQILSGNINLFDALGDKKLSELNLSAYNHRWTMADITANMASTSKFTYLLIDIGQDQVLDAYPSRFMYVATYAQLIWEQIFLEAGFQFTFNYPTLFTKLLLPSVKPPEYSKEWTTARSYYGYVPQSMYDAGDPAMNRPTIIRDVPFIQTDILPYFDSTNGNYAKPTLIYRADEAVRISVTGNTFVYLKASLGAAEAKLTLLVNDQVANKHHNSPELENGEVVEHAIKTTDVEGRNNEMALSVHVTDYLLQAGDTMRIRVELKGTTAISKWGFRLFHRYPTENAGSRDAFGNVNAGITPEQRSRNSLNIQVQPAFPEGGRVELTNWLPDMSQKDFVKAIVKLFGLNVQTDTFENRINFQLFDTVLSNKSKAIDWSRKIDYSKRPETLFTFGDFGQASRFVWKKDETVPDGLGDGAIMIENENLELEKDVVTMPFAASETRNVVVVPVYRKEVDEEGVKFTEQSVESRLIVRGENKIDLTLKDNITSQLVKSWGSYFINPLASYDLDFQRHLLPTYYAGLQAILKQVKFLRVDVKLTEQEFHEFDQLVPVWIEKYGAYFYVNLISQWESSEQLCRVELIRLTEI